MRKVPRYLAYLVVANNLGRLATLAMATLLLSSCASMSKEQCLAANWLDQGFRDGRTGQPLSRLEDHRAACAKVPVIPDDNLYIEGREQGILLYCTPENALQEGVQGRPYRDACPAELEHAFLLAYNKGKQVYKAEQQVEQLNSQSRQLEQSLVREDGKNQRRYLRRQLRELDWELQRARDEYRYLERQLRD